jgi:hypothetical protein
MAGISGMTGTPWHIEYLSSGKKKNIKNACIYYDTDYKICMCSNSKYYGKLCKGFNDCEYYQNTTTIISTTTKKKKKQKDRNNTKLNKKELKKARLNKKRNIIYRVKCMEDNSSKYYYISNEDKENLDSKGYSRVDKKTEMAQKLLTSRIGDMLIVNNQKYYVQIIVYE